LGSLLDDDQKPEKTFPAECPPCYRLVAVAVRPVGLEIATPALRTTCSVDKHPDRLGIVVVMFAFPYHCLVCLSLEPIPRRPIGIRQTGPDDLNYLTEIEAVVHGNGSSRV